VADAGAAANNQADATVANSNLFIIIRMFLSPWLGQLPCAAVASDAQRQPTDNVLRKAGAAVLPFSIFLFLLLRMMHLHQMARIIGGFDPVQDAIRKYLA
jgi:hypothetical protein